MWPAVCGKLGGRQAPYPVQSGNFYRIRRLAGHAKQVNKAGVSVAESYHEAKVTMKDDEEVKSETALLPEASWRETKAPVSLLEGAVHVWGAVVSEFHAVLPGLAALLTPEELARAGRFRFERDQHSYFVAHGLLRLLLMHELSVPSALLPLGVLGSGKPVLLTDGGLHPVRFNLSHSGKMVLIALARTRDVGVDVERVRDGQNAVSIVRRFFTANEASAFEKLPPEQQTVAFYCAWTRKEAFIKARGDTLAQSLRLFEVSFDLTHPSPLLWLQPPSDEIARWQICTLPVGYGYQASLAVNASTCFVHLHRASPQLCDNLEIRG